VSDSADVCWTNIVYVSLVSSVTSAALHYRHLTVDDRQILPSINTLLIHCSA